MTLPSAATELLADLAPWLGMHCPAEGIPVPARGAERPAFVMTELNTPSSDGREALRQIKADGRLKAIAVVVDTTSANPDDATYCCQRGANAHHVKPVSCHYRLQMLTARFDLWLVDVIKPTAQRRSP